MVPTAQSTIPMPARTHIVSSILDTTTAITRLLEQRMVTPRANHLLTYV
jgi:hypothetical protein